MDITRLITSTYAMSLSLYPRRFRDEYAEEMLWVFSTRLADAHRHGPTTVFVTCVRELVGIPFSVAAQHWLNYAENVSLTGRRPRHSAWWGAVGFGLAFALIQLVPRGGHVVGMISMTLAGALAGTLLGLASLSRRQMARFALIGALAFSAGEWLANEVISQIGINASPQSPWISVVFLVEPLILGILIGGLTGAVQRDWKRSVSLAVTCAMAFELGRFVGFAVSIAYWGIAQAIDTYRPGFDGRLSDWVVTGASLMIGLVASVISGLVGGALLGCRASGAGVRPTASGHWG